MPPSQLSLYQQLKLSGQLLYVGVDDVKILTPADSARKVNSIGTCGLNGCRVVVVLGEAILLAHISPLPSDSSQRDAKERQFLRDQRTDKRSLSTHVPDIQRAGAEHLDRFLQRISGLLRERSQFFDDTSSLWGIFSFGPQGQLDTVFDQIRAHFHAVGFKMNPAWYKERDPQSHRIPEGEVVAYIHKGHRKLMLEAKVLWSSNATPVDTASPSGSRTASTVVQRPLRLETHAKDDEEDDEDDGDKDDDDNEEASTEVRRQMGLRRAACEAYTRLRKRNVTHNDAVQAIVRNYLQEGLTTTAANAETRAVLLMVQASYRREGPGIV